MDEKTTCEVSNWHENFDDRVYKNVDQAMNEAKELSESTYELDDIYMREFRTYRTSNTIVRRRLSTRKEKKCSTFYLYEKSKHYQRLS